MSKKIVLKKSVVAVALTLASSHVVLAQDVPADTPVQKITVTGSNIKRIDAETATPVQIMRREEILRLGVNSVREALDTLTSSTGSLSDISGSNSFAGGASGVDLRGLGKQSTLILLNSRRVAPYALADYSEVFTNLDALPLEAIDRIEVLRSGGSAIYGSDAVAGVINIITRSDFKGLVFKADRDESLKNGKFHTTTASITGGFGDLSTDRYNVLGNVEYFKRGDVVWRDVIDDINPAYGSKFPAVKPGSGLTFGNRGTPSTFSYPGNIIGVGPIAGCTTKNAAGLCVYDRYSRFGVEPSSERVNMLVSGKLKISEKLEGFSEVLYSNTRTRYTSAFETYDSNGRDTVWGDPATGLGRTFSSRSLPPTHPLNTSGDSAALRYRFADTPDAQTVDASQYRFLAGLRGSWDKYDWETAVGFMGGDSKALSRNSLSDSGFKKVIGDYNAADDPLFFNRDYKIGQVNSAAVLNTLFPVAGYDGKITQEFVDAKISGEIGKIGDRSIGLATGIEFRHENLKITPTDNLAAGDIVGNGTVASNASRSYQALFGELNLPLTKALEVQAAARVDKFPAIKAHISPKLAARYEVSKQFLLRTTVETGFRAPNLTESAPSTKFAFNNGTRDPKRCTQARALADDLRNQSDALPADDPNKSVLSARADIVEQNECAAGVASILRNNPDLKPEESRSGTFGFVLEPSKGFNVSMDYFTIKRRDEIGYKATDELLSSEDAQLPGVVNRASFANCSGTPDPKLPPCLDKTFTAAERAQYGVNVGPLVSTSGKFENTNKTKTSGIDLAAGMRFDTTWGKLNLDANATYLLDYSVYAPTRNGGSYGDNLAGRYGRSKLVANLAANLHHGNFTNGLRVTYQSPTALQGDYFDDGYTLDGCKEKNWTAAECGIASYIRWDYNFSYTGIKNLTLSAFVRNLFDHRPPQDLKAFDRDGGGVIPQSADDVRGRSVRLTAEYKFR